MFLCALFLVSSVKAKIYIRNGFLIETEGENALTLKIQFEISSLCKKLSDKSDISRGHYKEFGQDYAIEGDEGKD